jgi:hypothetical protein
MEYLGFAPVRPGLIGAQVKGKAELTELTELKETTVTATQHVRRMRGGSQSHLMRCSNNRLYVVKFRNNPQGVRVLANEFIVSNIAQIIGLSVPTPAIVEVDEGLIQHSPELNICVPDSAPVPCDGGLQYGSEYAIDPLVGRVWDWLPIEELERVRNRREFAGMLLLDKWLCNLDSRQTVFWRRGIERKYSACFIDHGNCLGASDWEFRDHTLRGAFPRNEVYRDIAGWESFEPWMSRITNLNENLIWSVVSSTPPLWYRSDRSALQKLAETIIARRSMVNPFIERFRSSQRRPFPMWERATETLWIESDADHCETMRLG